MFQFLHGVSVDVHQTVSCNKFCDIAKIRSMAINRIPLGYVNNNDKNRYLEKILKAAVHGKTPDQLQAKLGLCYICGEQACTHQ